MEGLIDQLQALFSESWGLGLQSKLDAILSAQNWEDKQVQMSFSAVYYRARCHAKYGTWKIELENENSPLESRITVHPVNPEGFTNSNAGYTLSPSESQLKWIKSDLARIRKQLTGIL